MTSPALRPGATEELPRIEQLYRRAFPAEDLIPLLRALAPDPALLLSLIATDEAGLAGHIAFSGCALPDAPARLALLGPLAVDPAAQGRGIGSALVREGLRRMADDGVAQVLVLGDPAFYGRFGFTPEAAIRPPYALPKSWSGAWRSLRLRGDGPAPQGVVPVPAPWRDPALWST